MDSFIFRMQCSKLFESFIARTIVNEDELCFSMRLLTQNIGDTASLIVEKRQRLFFVETWNDETDEHWGVSFCA